METQFGFDSCQKSFLPKDFILKGWCCVLLVLLRCRYSTYAAVRRNRITGVMYVPDTILIMPTASSSSVKVSTMSSA